MSNDCTKPEKFFPQYPDNSDVIEIRDNIKKCLPKDVLSDLYTQGMLNITILNFIINIHDRLDKLENK